jgi:hypothetical protein
MYFTGKKNPAWEAGLYGLLLLSRVRFVRQRRGFCWILLLLFIRFFSTSYDYSYSYFSSSGFDVCVQMSNTATACMNLFLCATYIKQVSCHIKKVAIKTISYIILLVSFHCRYQKSVINSDTLWLVLSWSNSE